MEGEEPASKEPVEEEPVAAQASAGASGSMRRGGGQNDGRGAGSSKDKTDEGEVTPGSGDQRRAARVCPLPVSRRQSCSPQQSGPPRRARQEPCYNSNCRRHKEDLETERDRYRRERDRAREEEAKARQARDEALTEALRLRHEQLKLREEKVQLGEQLLVQRRASAAGAGDTSSAAAADSAATTALAEAQVQLVELRFLLGHAATGQRLLFSRFRKAQEAIQELDSYEPWLTALGQQLAAWRADGSSAVAPAQERLAEFGAVMAAASAEPAVEPAAMAPPSAANAGDSKAAATEQRKDGGQPKRRRHNPGGGE